SNHQRENFRDQFFLRAFDNTYTHRQLKTARPSASGIEVENVIAPGNFWLMGVAEDHSCDGCGSWIEIQRFSVVQEIKQFTSEFHSFSWRQSRTSACVIYISADCCHRCNLSQGHQNLVISNISCMQNVRASLQCLNSFGSQKTVCIGNDSDTQAIGCV